MNSRLPHDIEAIIGLLVLIFVVVLSINMIAGAVCSGVLLVVTIVIYLRHCRW